MKYQEEVPGFEELKKRLSAEQENFKKQFEEVKKQYPLVAFALSLQEAARGELSHVGPMADPPMSVLYDSLTGRIMPMRPRPPWQRPRWMDLLKAFHDCVHSSPIGSPNPECIWIYLRALYAMLHPEPKEPPPPPE